MTPEEQARYDAEVERVASQPQWRIDVTAPDGRRWTCYGSDLNWSVIQQAFARSSLGRA